LHFEPWRVSSALVGAEGKTEVGRNRLPKKKLQGECRYSLNERKRVLSSASSALRRKNGTAEFVLGLRMMNNKGPKKRRPGTVTPTNSLKNSQSRRRGNKSNSNQTKRGLKKVGGRGEWESRDRRISGRPTVIGTIVRCLRKSGREWTSLK